MPDRSKTFKPQDCPHVRPLLLPYLHADLPARQQEAVARHLTGCGSCRDQLQETQAFEARLAAESSLPVAAMDRQASARMAQNLNKHLKREIKVNRTLQIAASIGVVLFVTLLLAGVINLVNHPTPAAMPFTPTAPLVTLTLIPPTPTPMPETPTPVPSLAPSATARLIPGSVIPFTYQDLKFQVSQVLVDDSLGALPATTHNVTVILLNKDDLVYTTHGHAPKDAQYNGVLIIQTALQSGDLQKFLGLNLKINEGGTAKSPSAILAEDGGPVVFWVYVIHQSSPSFLLELPNQARVDVRPLIRPTPYNFNR